MTKTTQTIPRDPYHELNHHRKAGPMTSRGKAMSEDEIMQEQLEEFLEQEDRYFEIEENEKAARQSRKQDLERVTSALLMWAGCKDYTQSFQQLIEEVYDRWHEETGKDVDDLAYETIPNGKFYQIIMALSKESF